MIINDRNVVEIGAHSYGVRSHDRAGRRFSWRILRREVLAGYGKGGCVSGRRSMRSSAAHQISRQATSGTGLVCAMRLDSHAFKCRYENNTQEAQPIAQ